MSETASETGTAEGRTFPPPPELAAQANVGPEVYEEASRDRLGFWAKQAERLTWEKPWDEVLDWTNPPFAKWFIGGKLNVAHKNAPPHAGGGDGDPVAHHRGGGPGGTPTTTHPPPKGEGGKGG